MNAGADGLWSLTGDSRPNPIQTGWAKSTECSSSFPHDLQWPQPEFTLCLCHFSRALRTQPRLICLTDSVMGFFHTYSNSLLTGCQSKPEASTRQHSLGIYGDPDLCTGLNPSWGSSGMSACGGKREKWKELPLKCGFQQMGSTKYSRGLLAGLGLCWHPAIFSHWLSSSPWPTPVSSMMVVKGQWLRVGRTKRGELQEQDKV